MLRDWLRDYFAVHPAILDFGVQLRTDTKRMPVEDVSAAWSTKRSPYRTAEPPPQESFSPARRVYAEDVMSWRPWCGLVDHRPLGSVNRARMRVSEVLGGWRHESNATAEQEPGSLDQIPA